MSDGPVTEDGKAPDDLGCEARYYLNHGIRCYVFGPHVTHRGVYMLAGRTVTWTDDDKLPGPPPPSKPSPPPAPPKTALQEAFERASRMS